jgi:sulfatase maturation enzyme AslB (radical SAM superfamily)
VTRLHDRGLDLGDGWVRAAIGDVYVQMFDVALANCYREPHGLCVHSQTCGLVRTAPRRPRTL